MANKKQDLILIEKQVVGGIKKRVQECSVFVH